MRYLAAVLFLALGAGCMSDDLKEALIREREQNADLMNKLSRLGNMNADLKGKLDTSTDRIRALETRRPRVSPVLPMRPGDEKIFTVKGNLVKTSNVLFRPGGYEITKQAALDILDRWGMRLSQPDIGLITIEGHTDPDPIRHARAHGVQNNPHLSVLRAAAVANRLIKAGVPETRIVIIGCGSRQPVASAVKSRNRRVEMRIYGTEKTASAGRVPPPK